MNKDEAAKYLQENWGKRGTFEDDDGAVDTVDGILSGIFFGVGGEWLFINENGDVRDNFTPESEKKKRLLTIKEIWGKTLIHPDGSMGIVDTLDRNGNILGFNDPTGWVVSHTVQQLHDNGVRLADETLTYENATSLEVDDE